MTEVTREDVIRKIDLANENLNYSDSVQDYDLESRQLFATQALAQAQLATAYATLLVADNQPLGVLSDIVDQLKFIAGTLNESRPI